MDLIIIHLQVLERIVVKKGILKKIIIKIRGKIVEKVYGRVKRF